MNVRQPVASNFYQGNCKQQIKEFLKEFKTPSFDSELVGGIVPHAGWFFSGAIATKVLKTIADNTNPESIIILGAVHSWNRSRSVYTEGAWKTPLGEVSVDTELATKITDELSGLVNKDLEAHKQEHSIEVQLPIIKELMPKAKIVPISVPPDNSASEFGLKLGQFVKNQSNKIAIIASADLTHYGSNYSFTPAGSGDKALEWMKENDKRIIDLAINMDGNKIVDEAANNQNSCGSGAMAAITLAAKELGVTNGHLLQYITSHEVYPQGEFSMAVGYAGIVF